MHELFATLSFNDQTRALLIPHCHHDYNPEPNLKEKRAVSRGLYENLREILFHYGVRLLRSLNRSFLCTSSRPSPIFSP